MPTRRSLFALPRWTPDEARDVIAALEQSGKSVSLFAAEHDLDAQRLYVWRRRLGARAERTTFEEVAVRAPVGGRALREAEGFEVQLPSGTVIRLPESFEPAALVMRSVILARVHSTRVAGTSSRRAVDGERVGWERGRARWGAGRWGPMSDRAKPVPNFLVVDDVDGVVQAVARILHPFGGVTVAYSVDEGISVIGSRVSWTAAFIDLHLLEGKGTEVLEALRDHDPHVPALVMTVDARQEYINRIHDLGGALTCKPIDSVRLTRFATEAIAAEAERNAQPTDVVRVWEDRYDLAPAHAVILRGRLTGMSRSAIARSMRITPKTMKTHVHNLLQRTGDPTFDAAALRAMCEAWGGLVESTP
jgi:DNA-binding NarL/FixJ family response regulator/transposase-like protein